MKKIRLLLILFIIASLSLTVSAAELLIPGGELVGLSLQDNTVSVAAFEQTIGDTAKAAGLREGDRILRINDTPVTCVEDIRSALDRSDGQVALSVLRGDKTKNLSLRPTATADGPRLGIYLKQGTSGVGTVTYYRPDGSSFAALGHGVNTAGGELLKMQAGTVYPARVMSVKKGAVGKPGQLMGALADTEPLGTLAKNTARGVFGKLERPAASEPLPVAARDSIHTGKATIRSTIADTGVREYSVEILKIYPNAPDHSRNMLIKVTDPTLLTTTGGIVQGMSGSPIIQDGKLVGAVTHVLVNDPTMGYGIFIENMLNAAA